MNEFRFEVKYMLKMYYNLNVIKTMKKLLVQDVEKLHGIESEEYELASEDYKETEKCIKLLKNMVSTYYNIDDEKEIDKKISDFVRNDPYYKLTKKLADQFYKSVFDRTKLSDEIN
jgi:hypothetical protein|tara:strand:- start:2520 stop:2867 length:348 start_codon:yes stop_codon:yes gene_type:complete